MCGCSMAFWRARGCGSRGLRVALAASTSSTHHSPTHETGEALAWALDPGVVAARRRVRELGSGDLGHHIFARVYDKPAKTFRAHLRLAGVTRAELFERTPHRRPIRVHPRPARLLARWRLLVVAPRSG
jgi:hypothetical protein